MNRKRIATLSAIVVGVLALTFAWMPTGTLAAVQNNVKNYFSPCSGVNCDNTFNVGGTLAVASTATVTGLVTAPSNATYKVARGTVTLDGSNPTAIATGLTSVISCAVTLKQELTPGLDPYTFTVVHTPGESSAYVYAWKATSSGDPTLIASTNSTGTVDWVCVGT